MSEYYNPSGAPGTSSSGASSVMRAEFTAIEAAFAKLPVLAGNGDFIVKVNTGGTALESISNASVLTLIGGQPLDTDLSAIAALSSAADKMPYATGGGTWALATLSSFARTLLDDATAVIARATLGAGIPVPMYASGCVPTNDVGSANDTIDISAGTVRDSTNAADITLGAFTKKTGGVWTAGTGNNGMGQGLTVGNNTWYHIFDIINAGVADVYFDTSVTAANKPASTTAFRRRGGFMTDGSAHIRQFLCNELPGGALDFGWKTIAADVSNTTQSTSGVSYALPVPLGIKTKVTVQYVGSTGAAVGTNDIRIYDPAQSDVATTAGSGLFSGSIGVSGVAGTITNGGVAEAWSDTSSQLRAIASHAQGSGFVISVIRWIDPCTS